MKRLFLTLIAILFVVFGFAQSFVFTPTGVVNSDDPTKNHVVVDMPNNTKDELFTKAHQYITSAYVSPQDVMSVSGTDMIAINGFLETPYNDGLHSCKCDVKYRVNLAFKDGRFRCEFLIISMDMNFSGKRYPLSLVKQGMTNGVFKKDGSLTKGGILAKPYIEAVPNGIIEGIKNVQSPAKSEDW